MAATQKVVAVLSAAVRYVPPVPTTVPVQLDPLYQANVSAPVPPEADAVRVIDWPRSIDGSSGVTLAVSAAVLTVTVSVALTVVGFVALSVTETQYVVVADRSDVTRVAVVERTAPTHADPANQAKPSGFVPPDGSAVSVIDCPMSIEGPCGRTDADRAEVLTVTVSVAVAVEGTEELSVTATQ